MTIVKIHGLWLRIGKYTQADLRAVYHLFVFVMTSFIILLLSVHIFVVPL